MELHLPFLDPSPVPPFPLKSGVRGKGEGAILEEGEKGDLPSLFPTSGTLHESRVVLLSSID